MNDKENADASSRWFRTNTTTDPSAGVSAAAAVAATEVVD